MSIGKKFTKRMSLFEHAPSTVSYRKSDRISVKTLLDSEDQNSNGDIGQLGDKKIAPHLARNISVATPVKSEGVKLGWVNGVLIPVLLNIWGVIMFLRLGYVVGQAGIVLAWMILLCGKVVTTLTSLSLCAICTNGEVKGGGVYFLVSRALGPIHGGVIGVLFFIAQAVATSMYIIGFAESFSFLLVESGVPLITGNQTNDLRLIGVITLILLQMISIVGMGWFAKTQMFLLVSLVLAMVSVAVGSFFPGVPNLQDNNDAGFVGYASRNWGATFIKDPVSLEKQSFFTVFSIFFPACTGIMAGANLSGDLRDPSVAIPKGTLLGIGMTAITYAILILIIGLACVVCMDVTDPTTCTDITASIESGDIPSGGLVFNKMIMKNMSIWAPLLYLGVFAATLSSALASMVGAPRILQSLAADKIYPWRWVAFFAQGHGPSNDPWRGYALTFVICLGCCLIAQLDVIAPLISNFFMISYAFTNYACFASSWARYPGWRPSFKYYNKWLSLFGFIICVVVMFLMDIITTIITLGLAASMYIYLNWADPDVSWGAAGEALKYLKAVRQVEIAQGIDHHVKIFRPQFLVMSGPPSKGGWLIKFVSLMGKGGGVVICGDIIPNSEIGTSESPQDTPAEEGDMLDSIHESQEMLEDEEQPLTERSVVPEIHSESAERLSRYVTLVEKHRNDGDTFLENSKIWTNTNERCSGAFFDAVVAGSNADGLQNLLQTSGLGRLRPNTVVFGFKTDWQNSSAEEIKDYEIMIRMSLASNLGVLVVRDEEKLFDFDNEGFSAVNRCLQKFGGSSTVTEGSQDGYISSVPQNPGEKLRGDTIDVWWLADDGGLTMLLPYLITQHKSMRQNQKLRVLTMPDYHVDETKRLQKSEMRMVHLLNKFRIDANVEAVDLERDNNPSTKIIEEFEQSSGFKLDELDGEEKRKTVHILKLTDLIRNHTNERTSMIFLTLPIPIKGVQAGVYSAWLNILSVGLPPTIMIRGNNENVMTFLC